MFFHYIMGLIMKNSFLWLGTLYLTNTRASLYQIWFFLKLPPRPSSRTTSFMKLFLTLFLFYMSTVFRGLNPLSPTCYLYCIFVYAMPPGNHVKFYEYLINYFMEYIKKPTPN